MSDIFLSYASEDLERITPLAAALTDEGWTVFYDRTIPPGKTWRQVIGKEIEQCRCMVVCWSTHAVNSHWVIEEAEIGFDREILVPLLLDQIKPPMGFASIQAANLVDWAEKSNSPGYLSLCHAVSELIGPQKKTSTKSSASFIEPDMVIIPAGRFLMGSNGFSNEQPIHPVNIAKSFSLAKYLVTFDEHDLYAKAKNQKLPSDHGWGRGRRPVSNVSWEDAAAYANWLSELTGKSFRLPTEAEWEYAVRAGATTPYYWSYYDPEDFAWFSGNSEGKTQPVGLKKPNAFGLYDMSGNIMEWVQDCWHDNYDKAPEDGSAWQTQNNADCVQRVLRGGSWSSQRGELRSSFRSGRLPWLRYNDVGFRLAQDLP